jgi:hypothetical protein
MEETAQKTAHGPSDNVYDLCWMKGDSVAREITRLTCCPSAVRAPVCGDKVPLDCVI